VLTVPMVVVQWSPSLSGFPASCCWCVSPLDGIYLYGYVVVSSANTKLQFRVRPYCAAGRLNGGATCTHVQWPDPSRSGCARGGRTCTHVPVSRLHYCMVSISSAHQCFLSTSPIVYTYVCNCNSTYVHTPYNIEAPHRSSSSYMHAWVRSVVCARHASTQAPIHHVHLAIVIRVGAAAQHCSSAKESPLQ